MRMNVDLVSFTRQLVDIESITGNEGEAARFLQRELAKLGYDARLMPVEGDRANVWATSPHQPNPAVVFSTHIDTVPPFIPSSEDEHRIYGRGSCDAKGIVATQIAAAERLKKDGIHVGLLFLVGEESDSQGAKIANTQPKGCKFLINGEPTDNRIAIASKGSLRLELVASGRMAHSAYPELGESAIDRLIRRHIEVLLSHRMREMNEAAFICGIKVSFLGGIGGVREGECLSQSTAICPTVSAACWLRERMQFRGI